jgi:hypothetical protein
MSSHDSEGEAEARRSKEVFLQPLPEKWVPGPKCIYFAAFLFAAHLAFCAFDIRAFAAADICRCRKFVGWLSWAYHPSLKVFGGWRGSGRRLNSPGFCSYEPPL